MTEATVGLSWEKEDRDGPEEYVMQKSPPRSLIAEDNSLLAFNLEDILREIGCETAKTTAKVAEGLRLIEEAEFDFAIVDMILADGTSEPLMEALRQRGVPFAISSGMQERELTSDYPDVPILAKPYGAEAVGNVVAMLTRAMEPERACA
jgi:CheY-like chemotaxis protein